MVNKASVKKEESGDGVGGIYVNVRDPQVRGLALASVARANQHSQHPIRFRFHALFAFLFCMGIALMVKSLHRIDSMLRPVFEDYTPFLVHMSPDNRKSVSHYEVIFCDGRQPHPRSMRT